MNRYHYRLNLIDPFGISRGTRSTMDVVLVEIDGGWGESSPIPYYSESPDTVEAALDRIEQIDLGDLDAIENVVETINTHVPHDQSAKAAFDIALHDRLGRKRGMPLYRIFGKAPTRPMVTSFTIGLSAIEEMMRKVEVAKKYDILKIKLGKDLQQDLAVMAAIRKAVGEKSLRVDANGGWTLDEARQALRALADLGIEYVEQPLEKGSIEELRELKRTSPLPIFVDEDSLTAADLPALQGAIDGINIKLMKSGGLVEARRMISLAEKLGFQVMLGCMIETSVAITAAAHLAPFADYLDLDGSLLVSNDPFSGVRFDERGWMTLPEKPGLGVEFREGYSVESLSANDRQTA